MIKKLMTMCWKPLMMFQVACKELILCLAFYGSKKRFSKDKFDEAIKKESLI
jgi:hypothetical protein